MSNRDMPAYPYISEGVGQVDAGVRPGLTKREIFAMAAMQGVLANREVSLDYVMGAKHAIRFADELLNQLE